MGEWVLILEVVVMQVVKVYGRYIPIDKIQMIRFDKRYYKGETTEMIIRGDWGDVTVSLPPLDENEKDTLVTLIMNSHKVVIDVKELVKKIIESREVDRGDSEELSKT